MQDVNGAHIRLGDWVTIGSGIEGTVVLASDTDAAAPGFPKEQWDPLRPGILIHTLQAGLVFMSVRDEDLEILRPAAANPPST
jgi:hypothetical protein